MNIPETLYRWLPTLYIVAGSLLTAYGPGSIGKPSSLLMIWVGVAVFNMRLNNRVDSATTATEIKVHVIPNDLSGTRRAAATGAKSAMKKP